MANKIWTSWHTHLLNLSEFSEVTVKEYVQLFNLNRNAVQVAFLKLRRMKLVDHERKVFYTDKKMSHIPHYYYVYKLNDKGWRSVEHFKNKQKAILNKTIPLQNQTT